jgi:hypothetical protein
MPDMRIIPIGQHPCPGNCIWNEISWPVYRGSGFSVMRFREGIEFSDFRRWFAWSGVDLRGMSRIPSLVCPCSLRVSSEAVYEDNI